MATRPGFKNQTGFDLAIIGGGIAGGALAVSLSRAGFKTLVLERDRQAIDRVRGEYLVPWGVAEAQQLGLWDMLLSAGANISSTQMGYGDEVAPDAARRAARDFSSILPGVPGSLNIGHSQMCRLFTGEAERMGATVLRGVRRFEVTPGWPPRISFDHEGQSHTLTPRLVVGADGRGSKVARQAGIKIEHDAPTHLLGGMLVENAHDWPDSVHVIGNAKGQRFYVFPQGAGRLRLYLTAPLAKRREGAGADGPRAFLRHFDFPNLPGGRVIAAAKPIGPLQFYPNSDSWADRPTAPGVVLIGDAAGSNDPSLGQGLSITFRDVRLVAESLTSDANWSASTFVRYRADRRERMRRLRLVARANSHIFVDRTEADTDRRRRLIQRMTADPDFAPMFGACALGPHRLSPDAFDETAIARIMEA